MSEKRYVINPSPFIVPTTDGKLIEEHVGGASTGTAAYSLAHMVAPPHWSEPHQTPSFDGDVVELQAGQALLIKSGARVRYSNPFDAECEYWSICVPAFSPDTVNREAE